jgi:hypothetical protein
MVLMMMMIPSHGIQEAKKEDKEKKEYVAS